MQIKVYIHGLNNLNCLRFNNFCICFYKITHPIPLMLFDDKSITFINETIRRCYQRPLIYFNVMPTICHSRQIIVEISLIQCRKKFYYFRNSSYDPAILRSPTFNKRIPRYKSNRSSLVQQFSVFTLVEFPGLSNVWCVWTDAPSTISNQQIDGTNPRNTCSVVYTSNG